MAKKVTVKVEDRGHELPSAFELFRPSWEAVKLNGITFIELIIIPIMIGLVGSIFTHGHNALGFGIFVRLIGFIVGLILGPALTITQLASVQGKQIDFWPAVQKGLKFFWRYVLLLTCIAFMVIGGLILLIVPGIFMIRRYVLAPYYLIDQDLKVSEAMKKSAKQSKQFSSAVWGVLGVELLFALLTVVLIGIVLIIMYYCASTLRYEQIKAATKKAKA